MTTSTAKATATAKQHYDALLGAHYRWLVAGDGDPYASGQAWLARHQLAVGATVLDLGAGFGAHAVPLARAGAAVTAVDFHAGLLAELRAAAPSVATVEADLVSFVEAAAAGRAASATGGGPSITRWDTILCLGDTLTHLADAATVQRLLAGAARILSPGGVLALSYRDYSGPPRTGVDRFLRVRSDATRALVCCLDPLDADRLSVTDILTVVTPAGLETQISSYPKLRLAPATVATWAASAGLALDHTSTEAGMVLQQLRPAAAQP